MIASLRGCCRTDDGSAIVEITWLTLLLLVPLIYIVISAFEVQRASFGVSAASRAAARAYVLAPDESIGHERATQAARVALEDQGLSLSPGEISIHCEPRPDVCLSPDSVIVVSLDTQVALPLVPDALGGNTPSIQVGSTHRAPYGTFREARQ